MYSRHQLLTCALNNRIVLPLAVVMATTFLAVTTVTGFTGDELPAEARQHYAFQPLNRPTPPSLSDSRRPLTSIDAFVVARLESQGLNFSGESDRRTLIRRASFDLIGLPPSAEEVDAFAGDDSADAYEQLLDRLLDSSHFGERWGRYWLDAAGYVDVHGSDENNWIIRIPRGAGRYRDYVIQSFNGDKPYDRFLVEQIAGDELVDWRNATEFTPEIRELLVATGFLRTAIDDTDDDALLLPSNLYAVIFNQVQIFGTSVLGLTLQCARCHEHKYDPIPQEDYFRLMAHFTAAYNPAAWVKRSERMLRDVSATEMKTIEAHNAVCDAKIIEIQKQLASFTRSTVDRVIDERVAKLPKPVRKDVKDAIQQEKVDERTEVQKYLVATFSDYIGVSPRQLAKLMSPAGAAEVERLLAEVASVTASRRNPGWIQALYDTGPPPDTHLLIRGDVERPGTVVKPGLLGILVDKDREQATNPAKNYEQTSGQRLAFARRLSEPGSRAEGLVARVAVNRAWHHLFGRGLVSSPGNLGMGIDPPSHPLLLDWLASELVEGGWRLKPLLKQIMTSSVYRQASSRTTCSEFADRHEDDPSASPTELQTLHSIDPDNHLLWRMPLRRMDAETVRDAILCTSGKLNRVQGGLPLPLTVNDDGEVVLAMDQMPTPDSHFRRSLYITSRRNYHPTFVGSFDMPVMATNCTRRNSSTVVTQSLTLLNSEFMLRQADHFSDKVRSMAEETPQSRVDHAFRLAYQRLPTTDESVWAAALLLDQVANYRQNGDTAEQSKQLALSRLCQMLLCSNEFLYLQ